MTTTAPTTTSEVPPLTRREVASIVAAIRATRAVSKRARTRSYQSLKSDTPRVSARLEVHADSAKAALVSLLIEAKVYDGSERAARALETL